MKGGVLRGRRIRSERGGRERVEDEEEDEEEEEEEEGMLRRRIFFHLIELVS